MDRYLATQSPPEQRLVRRVSPEVQQVAKLYKGKTMVIIGGDCRPHAHEALKLAFCLKDLIWIPTNGRESTDIFVPSISRPDVAVVLLAIRWCRYYFNRAKAICDKYGKEFFRLPTGYSPNQVAHQILQHRTK